MSINSFFQFFVPKEKKFFPLFEEASINLILLAETLHEAVNAPKKERDEHFKKIEDLEATIEEITHKTHLELSKNFITPFDREDIHSLIKSIDNVADYMHSAASKMKIYHVEKITKSIRKLTEINLEACKLIGEGIKELKDMNNVATLKTGEQVYQAQCAACHGTGAAGAPKLADLAARGPRIGAGFEALLHSALKGKGAMGAQGGGDFSDFEIGRAVVYMANQGGAKFDEPKAPAAAASAAAN